ncbi:MAG: tripartite tricarboxylate transporter substrate binding protein [Betaproteobacteria bacterium]|nr:tripartite tricarboxylate transporter substrate binding protein [Betaproteobacteria bacterium]
MIDGRSIPGLAQYSGTELSQDQDALAHCGITKQYEEAQLNKFFAPSHLAAGLIVIGGAATAWPAVGEDYPTKPIRLILPFPPGGPVDTFARVLAPRLTASFGQQVVLDNRPGASGRIAIEGGIRAAPDGYTMLMVSSSYAGTAATRKLNYDPVNDMAPVALLTVSPQLMVVNPTVPAANVRELIDYAKTNPGKLNFGSSGTGGSIHLALELFSQMAGIRMTHVPYKGQGPAINEVVGGQIQLMSGSPLVIYPHVKSKRLRALGVSSAKRAKAMPDIPAIAETVPGYETLSWQAILGPKLLPNSLISRWNAELNRILETPDLTARLAGDGVEVAGGPPKRFLDQLRSDVMKWKAVVKTAGIKVAD